MVSYARTVRGRITARRGAIALVAALALILLLIALGVASTFVLWGGKDLGITLSPEGYIVRVTPGSLAERTGAVVGAQASPGSAYARLSYLETYSIEGYTEALQITVGESTDGRPKMQRTITLQASPAGLGKRVDATAPSLTGLCYVAMGLILFGVRQRSSVMWILFLTIEATGLMLMSGQVRLLSSMVAVVWAIVMPLWGAMTFHLHTIFPRQQLGRFRGPATVIVYLAAITYGGANLVLLRSTDPLFFGKPWYLQIVGIYMGFLWSACFLLLLSTFFTTRDQLIRQNLVLALLGFSGVIVFMLPAMLLQESSSRLTDFAGMLGSLLIPAGYIGGIIRGGKRDDSVLPRRRILVVAYSTLVSLAFLALAVALLTSTNLPVVIGLPATSQSENNEAILVWSMLTVMALVYSVGAHMLWQWIENRYLASEDLVRFVDTAVLQLDRTTNNLEGATRFFTNELPRRLKSAGSVVLVREGRAGLPGGETMWDDPVDPDEEEASVQSNAYVVQGVSSSFGSSLPHELRNIRLSDGMLTTLQDVGGPITINQLRAANPTANTSVMDQQLTQLLGACHAELILPLCSDNRVEGLVFMAPKETDEAYTTQELDAIRTLGRYASACIQRVHLVKRLQEQVTQLEEKSALLQEQQERNATLTSEMSDVRYEERARLKIAIHDTVLQYAGHGLDLIKAHSESLAENILAQMENVIGNVTDLKQQGSCAPLTVQHIEPVYADLISCYVSLCTALGERPSWAHEHISIHTPPGIDPLTDGWRYNNSNEGNGHAPNGFSSSVQDTMEVTPDVYRHEEHEEHENLHIAGDPNNPTHVRDSTGREDAAIQAPAYRPAPLELARTLIGQAIEHLNKIGLELRPEYLDKTLQDILQMDIALFRSVGGSRERDLRINLHVEGNEPTRLPDNVKVACRHIAHEAINNAVKHADARTITVSIEFRPNALTLTIEDDGRGLAPAADPRAFISDVSLEAAPEEASGSDNDQHQDHRRRHGQGMHGMKAHAWDVGGSLDVSSPSTGGTRITLDAPLSAVMPRLSS